MGGMGGGRDARGGKSSFVGRRTEARGDERLRISWRSEARAGKGLMHGGYRRREGLVTWRLEGRAPAHIWEERGARGERADAWGISET